MAEWGRIADDGTVYLRTADGERPIGSWQAGPAEGGLAFYRRKYDDLAAEVAVLEARVASADPKTVGPAARKLRGSLASAMVIGDLDALDRRLVEVLAKVDARFAEQAQERARAAEQAAAAKRTLVEEAERLAGSTQWRATSDRYRAIVEEWKTIRGVDRRTDTELWERLSTARRDFDRRRRTHFAERDKERDVATERKQQLALQAEKLADSTEWVPTARRFRELMAEWKAAGRATRETEAQLWERFKAAQDSFFAKRAEALAARDAELRVNLEAKQALVEEAERLDPVADLEGARKRLRVIHDRWEKLGRVPRESLGGLEDRLGAVERKVRDVGASGRERVRTESTLVVRLRESVGKLEARLARARAAGDERTVADTEQALQTQRAWLAQAERARD